MAADRVASSKDPKLVSVTRQSENIVPKEFTQVQWDDLLRDDCRHLVRLAVREDLDQGYDWTTVALVPESSEGEATLVSRETGVVAGLRVIPVAIGEMEAQLDWQPALEDGQALSPGSILGVLRGNVRDLLTTERLLLNFVGRLSGIASLTQQFVRRTEGTRAKIYDTRKTCPAYRRLDKFAVRCGGGQNHRSGLFDAILIKDNHLAFGSTDRATRYSPAEAVLAARAFVRDTLPTETEHDMVIEVEVDSLAQLEQVLVVGPDIVLLDNMTCSQLREAVARRDAIDAQVQLEASGGVTLETVSDIARTGVERISVGALTHSARCLDLGLDWG